MSVLYFNGYGRASPIDFMMNHAGINYERKQIHPVKFFGGSSKKTFNVLPVLQRSDGSYMRETVPMARYIARTHGYYPSNPVEAFRCDWFVQIYQPVINTMDLPAFMIGSTKTKQIKHNCEILLPEFFKKVEEFCKEGWLIGDGSKIYMCDFFVASILPDILENKYSWMP